MMNNAVVIAATSCQIVLAQGDKHFKHCIMQGIYSFIC